MPKRTPNKLQRVMYSIPFLLILLALVVLVGNSAWNMYQTYRDSQETVERLQQEEQELLAQENAITDAASGLSTPRGLEEEIREKFSVAKDGERVIVLVDDEDTDSATTTPEETWWQSWWSSVSAWMGG